ncbi:glutaredoxin family protein [Canibacter zhoujuaniae]|uniref:glutaredoxin family protein n=1 Tax=Canibacter zhoujuaniae TaxID=2708343 RepID=UPI001423F7D6|nr:glutaredoxin family protein [Canibacter zhoujuaniae]
MSETAVPLTLVGRNDCHLCTDAKAVIETVIVAAKDSDIAIEYREVSIDDDQDFAEKYGEDIPVVLVNGNVYASHIVYEDKLAYAVLYERDRIARSKRRWWRFGS